MTVLTLLLAAAVIGYGVAAGVHDYKHGRGVAGWLARRGGRS